ncbi:MAG: tetratricopeptide repeat protein [Oscillatoria sp. SIO1A7]|nr:tetratricopeptide repeat protein [Oscillatoria sp. SIO1A7]
MEKLVVLKLEGSIKEGFRATLEIGLEGDRPSVEVSGRLPGNLQIIECLEDFDKTYNNFAFPSQRIKAKKIIHKGSFKKRYQECVNAGQELSDIFIKWLSDDRFSAIDKRLRVELSPEEIIRLLIRTDNKDLQKLPWQEWDFFSSYPKAEFAFSPLESERPPEVKPKAKVKILAILGHSEGINTEADREELEKLADAEVTFLVKPSRQEINDKLWEQGWDIFFFAGHSQTEGEKGKFYINPKDSLTIEELKYGLEKAVAQGLQFAIFNSCDGLGLARELAALQVPQAIVMRKPVPDEVAQKFLKYFLRAFASGKPFYLAMREARERLQILENKLPCATWLPTICQNPAVVPPNWQDLLAQPEPEPEQNTGLNEQKEGSRFVFPRFGRKAWAAIAIGAVGAVGLVWEFGSPQVAKFLNNKGLADLEEGRLPEARKQLQIAGEIDPENRATSYNQGWMCEQAKNFDCAREKYQRAVELGLPAAYSNLARLYIKLDKDYANAVDLLWDGLELAKQDPVKYALHKNLGWARLEQGRYEEAIEHLEKAINLNKTRAAGYCLLAQVFDRQGNLEGAKAQWKSCLNYAEPQKPDEDPWIGMASQRLGELK